MKLEQSRERIGQLQEEVRSLQDQQETLLGAELAAARASWTCRQQEEISRLQNQHQAQLEQELGQAQEEAQQEVKEGLQEALQLLRRERESKRERTEERSDGSDVAVERSRGGGLRELCREALTRAMALARQDWNKVNLPALLIQIRTFRTSPAFLMQIRALRTFSALLSK